VSSRIKSPLLLAAEHPLITIAVTIIIFFAALICLPKLSFDNSVDVFFNKNGKSYIEFENWKEQFGSDQIVIVAFSDRDIFTYDNLALIKDLTERLEMNPFVDKVTSLTNVNDIVGDDKDFIVDPFIEDVPNRDIDLKILRQRAIENSLYTGSILSQDGSATALVIELIDDKENDDYKKEALGQITAIVKEVFPPGKKYHISGFAAIEHFYAAYMQDDVKKFIPFIFAVLALILFLSFRRLRIVCLPLFAISISLVLTLGILYLLGFTVNNVTTIIPPIILAIAVADSIHVVAVVIQGKKENITVSSVMKQLFIPCLLTSLTTMVGFFSLTLSSITPVRQLGIVAGLGLGIAFIVTFTFLPAVMKLFKIVGCDANKGPEHDKRSSFDGFINWLFRFNLKNKRAVIIATVVLVAFSLFGASRIKAETSVIEYFRKSSPIYSATTFIEENISGIHFLNVSLKAQDQDYFKKPQALNFIQDLQIFLKTIPQVDDTVSVVDYIKEVNKSFNNEDEAFYRIPDSYNLISQYILLYGSNDLNDYVDSRWQWTTVQVRLSEHSTAKLSKVIEAIGVYLENNKPESVTGSILGQTVLEVESNEAVTSGQVKSLALAFLAIFFMMFLVFKDFRLGLVSIVPNALPLVVTFGIMGWCGIRLNSATSMIAAVGIGIIVDDTIHFLHSFKVALAKNPKVEEAVGIALQEKTRPIVLTSIMLFFGFATVLISKFVPTFYFGLLSASLMLNALWADLIVLPSLLLYVYRKK
jgi:uncharacterized protein